MKKATIKVLIIVGVIVIAAFIIVFKPFSIPKAEFKNVYSVSEMFNTAFPLTDEEKNNIRDLLNEYVYENEEYWGFRTYKESLNLYHANALVEIAHTLNDAEALNDLRKELAQLERISLNSIDILNAIYYFNICNILNLKYNENELLTVLEKYYDSEEQLFFFFDKTDSTSTKISITYSLCRSIPDLTEYTQFNISDGVKTAYAKFEFSQDQSNTLYNSGGDILYCYSVLGYLDNVILARHKDWFESWKSVYESRRIDDFMSALDYSNYYSIAIIFDESYSNEKLRTFYQGLTSEDIPDNPDYFFINNAICHVNNFDNTAFNNYVTGKVRELVKTEPLIEADIDLLTTVHGVLLSENIEFEYNREKLQNYINSNYKTLETMDDTEEAINTLYYNLMLDVTLNDYKVSCNAKTIQKTIDKSIRSLEFKDSIVRDIHTARKAVEIVNCINIVRSISITPLDMDVYITKNQKNKIEKGWKTAISNDNIINSFSLSDLFLVDHIMGFILISEDMFLSAYHNLTVDGGTRASISNEYPADIFVTNQFMMCLIHMRNFDYLQDQQMYIAAMRVADGLYASEADESRMNLATVLYGNIIINCMFANGSK
jgi:hypothetical protein